MKQWAKIGAALALIWGLAGGVMYWVRASQPTAQSVTAYLERIDLSANRAKVIGKVESMMNDVSFEDRQRLNRSGATRKFFESLRPDEQTAFLDATLPAGFKQLMESFNKMDPIRRKRMVEGAVNAMKSRQDEESPRRLEDDKLAQRVIDQGLKSFYTDASADTKLDMAPLIEQLQRNLRGGGGQ